MKNAPNHNREKLGRICNESPRMGGRKCKCSGMIKLTSLFEIFFVQTLAPRSRTPAPGLASPGT